MLALEFIKKEGGIDDEASYPYHAMDQKCNFTREHSVMSDEGAIILAPGDGQLLKLYLALYGPMAVSIEATDHFMAYHSGVFSDPTCNHKLDHAVLVVGYGTSKDGKDYWIVVSIRISIYLLTFRISDTNRSNSLAEKLLGRYLGRQRICLHGSVEHQMRSSG